MFPLKSPDLLSIETTSVGRFPLFEEGRTGLLSLPTNTGSYDAGSFCSPVHVWTPDDLSPYLVKTHAIVEDESEREMEEHAYGIFRYSVHQLLERERASFGIYDATFDTQGRPTSAVALRSDDERLPEERWEQVGATLEIFSSFEDGWDGYEAPAPNQASIAVAQTLLRNLQPSVSVPRIMIDAEGDIVLTWSLEDGAVFLTVERSKLHLLVKVGEAIEKDESDYEGSVPRHFLSKLPKGA